MAIYLYASGAVFEELLNVYMQGGLGINPYNPKRDPYHGIRGIKYENATLPVVLLEGTINDTTQGKRCNGLCPPIVIGPLISGSAVQERTKAAAVNFVGPGTAQL